MVVLDVTWPLFRYGMKSRVAPDLADLGCVVLLCVCPSPPSLDCLESQERCLLAMDGFDVDGLFHSYSSIISNERKHVDA